jgi:hypothetical protein
MIRPAVMSMANLSRAGLTRYAVLRELRQLLAVMAGACHTCQRPFPLHTKT